MNLALTAIFLFLYRADAFQTRGHSPFPSLEKLYPLSVNGEMNGGYDVSNELQDPSSLERQKRSTHWTNDKMSDNGFRFGPFSYNMEGELIEGPVLYRSKRSPAFDDEDSITKADEEFQDPSEDYKSKIPEGYSIIGKKDEWSTVGGRGGTSDDSDTFDEPSARDAALIEQIENKPQYYGTGGGKQKPQIISGRTATRPNNKGRNPNKQSLSPPPSANQQYQRQMTQNDDEPFYGARGNGNSRRPIEPQSEENTGSIYQSVPLESQPVGGDFGGDAMEYPRAQGEKNPSRNNPEIYNRYQRKPRPQSMLEKAASSNVYRPAGRVPWTTAAAPLRGRSLPSEFKYPYLSSSGQRQRSSGRRISF